MYIETGPLNYEMSVERGRIATFTRHGMTEELEEARRRLGLFKAIRLVQVALDEVGDDFAIPADRLRSALLALTNEVNVP